MTSPTFIDSDDAVVLRLGWRGNPTSRKDRATMKMFAAVTFTIATVAFGLAGLGSAINSDVAGH